MMDLGFSDTLFVEVILPLSLNQNYTYRIPQHLNKQVFVGKRVLVQFGKTRIYTALIYKVSHQAPEAYQAKYVLDIIDEKPVVTPLQLKFWEWMSAYYLCNMGEIFTAALPSALKLSSETKISLQANFDEDPSILSSAAQNVFLLLHKKKQITVDEVMVLLEQKNVDAFVKELIINGFAALIEEVTDKFKPLRKSFLTLNAAFEDSAKLKLLFENLGKAPKQMDALLSFIKFSKKQGEVSKQQMMSDDNCSLSAINALIEKNILSVEKRIVSRLMEYAQDFEVQFQLSDTQNLVLQSIENQFFHKNVVLLHGVTSSGKTQIYIRLIEQVLLKNPTAQILYLLPEIALTTQLVERLSLYFGNKIAVYHSKFSDYERVEIWDKVKNNECQIVLGARSALFLPFQQLQFIVVDEEHEPSYKQQDPAPRYHARDVAILLGNFCAAKILLGSATPSIESWHHAHQGKYGFVELQERFGGVEMPQIEVVDMKLEAKAENFNPYFSKILLADIAQRLAQNEQVILFQNRRGFATLSICKQCGYSPKCVDCDVSLTYHKSTGKLHCHYCGYQQYVVKICPACGGVHLMQKGVGTEKIEEELLKLFPHTLIGRLDLDSTRKKNSMQSILSDFKTHKIQILIGTQMVAKGLDFDDVTLIGVLGADSLLNFPDFRANERAFQLMAQVAGRAGRRQKQGKVLIQTFVPKHKIISQVVHHQYAEMVNVELSEREVFKYPPYYRMINIRMKHKEEAVLMAAAKYFAQLLKNQLSDRVLGPEEPLISRIRNQYIQHILIKVEASLSVKTVKQYLMESVQFFHTQKVAKGIVIQLDVDPS